MHRKRIVSLFEARVKGLRGARSVLGSAVPTGLRTVAMNCSPHPLDVLAIYALYQQVSSP